MATRTLYQGSKSCCPWKKLFRVMIAAVTVAIAVHTWNSFSTIIHRSKHLPTDTNFGKSQAGTLERNPVKDKN